MQLGFNKMADVVIISNLKEYILKKKSLFIGIVKWFDEENVILLGSSERCLNLVSFNMSLSQLST